MEKGSNIKKKRIVEIVGVAGEKKQRKRGGVGEQNKFPIHDDAFR